MTEIYFTLINVGEVEILARVVRFWICVVRCVAVATTGRFCTLGTSFASNWKAFARLGCAIINSEWRKLCQTRLMNAQL